MSDTAMKTVPAFDESSQPLDQPSQHEHPARPRKEGPGAELAVERELQLMTIEQVATQLNLAPRQIVALEEDNFAALPGMASVRGFIRSYAKLLKLEPEPLLAKITLESVAVVQSPLSTRRAVPTPFAEGSRLPTLGEPKSSSKRLVGAVLVAITVVLGIVAHQMGWIPPLRNLGADRFGVESSAILHASEVAIASTTSVAEGRTKMEVLDQSITTSATTTDKDSALEGVNTASTTAATNLLVSQTLPASDKQQAAATPVPASTSQATTTVESITKNSLLIKSYEDSWVEIKRNDMRGAKAVLLSRVVKAGETELIELDAPVTVIIGNAKGINMSLRGSPVDLKTDVKNNVARLQLK